MNSVVELSGTGSGIWPGRGWRAFAVAAVCCAALTGCGDSGMRDLQVYREQVLERKGGRIEEPPPIEPYLVYIYESGQTEAKDPFEPFFGGREPDQPPDDDTGKGGGITPNFERNREELEAYTLDSIRMMGTLELQDEVWGIVRSPDSLIHRVQIGNYMGKNHGKVLSVSEEAIEITEIIPDGQGGWTEREASIALLE